MGIDKKSLELLLLSKASGVDFLNTITIGRQGLHASEKEVYKLINEFGPYLCSKIKSNKNITSSGYIEGLLELLGASNVSSIDYSDYEGATIIHDLNLPIKADMTGKFSAVVEAGTLEHIYNAPQAIENCLSMVKQNGHVVFIVPANNFFGHGMYQFSPELFTGALSEGNGFKIIEMILFDDLYEIMFKVKLPLDVNDRISISSASTTRMFVLAKRIGESHSGCNPQQSDYVHKWSVKQEGNARSFKSSIKREGILQRIFNRILFDFRKVKAKVSVKSKYPEQYFQHINIEMLIKMEGEIK